MAEQVLFEGRTGFEHYEVVDMVYEGRPARILFSGHYRAAQSGIGRDNKPELLFDYNQRFLELIRSLKPKKILLIGGGVYTLPMAILQHLPTVRVDAVEIDPGLDDIARKYFGLKEDPRLRIFHQEGAEFLKKTTDTYDAILIDAFSNLEIPASLRSQDTIKLLSQRTDQGGVTAINVISSYKGRDADVLINLYDAYCQEFAVVQVHPAGVGLIRWISQNFLLIGAPGQLKKQLELRYGPLPRPTP